MKTFARRPSQRADYDPLKTRSNSTASPIQQNSNDNSDPYAFTDAAHGSIKAAAKEDSQQVSAAALFSCQPVLMLLLLYASCTL
jgi:hypothetical protein